MRRDRLDARAVVILLVCCVLWGLNQVAAKVALAEVPPLTQAALRSLGAAVLVLGWARWRGIELFGRDGTLRSGLLAGALFAGEFACIFVGLQFTSASRMVVFIYMSPFVVALGMPLLSSTERLSAMQWAGLAVAFLGVAWAFAEGFAPGAAAPAGQWLGDALLYQLAVSGALLALAAMVAGETWPSSWGAVSLASLAFQTVVVSFASYLAWFWLVRHYPAARIAAFTLLTPVAGLFAGVLLLGEPLTLRLAVALGAVVAGLALVNRR